MTLVPRYAFDPGTQITLRGQDLTILQLTADGYEVVDAERQTIEVIPFAHCVSYLKMPGAGIECVRGPLNPAQARLGELYSHANATEDAQDEAKFRLALCTAMRDLEQHLRKENGDSAFQLSNRKMNELANRRYVRDVAKALFGQSIYLNRRIGQKHKHWEMKSGRILMDDYRLFSSLPADVDPLDAFVPLSHKKGNRVPRIADRLRDLMTEAWEEVGLDLKQPYASNVYAFLEMRVTEENWLRERNGLGKLVVPSQKTLKAHREMLLSPTEFLLATHGGKHAENKRGRGSSDVRATAIAELCEIDECKASLVASAKANGTWERLSSAAQDVLEDIDEEIRRRLVIIVIICVATRMPLAWIISDAPKAEATLAAYRMATRDKLREKIIYGCEGDPVPACGLGMIKNDNGTGLRNVAVKSALLGTGAAVTDVCVHAAAHKPFVERMFGTTESVLFKIVHGDTGRRPGKLTNYDAVENGVLDIDELYGIMTRFFIDEYPSMRHYGIGMNGRRPAEVLKQVNEEAGFFRHLDPNSRRIHLGWEVKAKPNDEGVRVFHGLWYNSPEFQKVTDRKRVKVKVFIDPENVNHATAIVPGEPAPLCLTLQTTVFADLTLPEVLALMAEHRKEDPTVTQIYEDRLARTRRARHELLKKIGVERKLPRSHSTFTECMAKAKAVFAGARIVKTDVIEGTVAAGSIMSSSSSDAVFKLGSGPSVIDQTARDADFEDEATAVASPLEATPARKPATKKTNSRQNPKRLGRPSTEGKLT